MRRRFAAPAARRQSSAYIAGLVLLLASTHVALLAQQPDPAVAARLMDDLMWARGDVGGPFRLIDHTGKTRTDADFRGKLLIVYFGYTSCPDICPTDLREIGLALDKLGAAGDDVQPLFISLDPVRDTVDVLANYIAAFHPRLVGLTGTPAQISAVAHSFKAYYARSALPEGGLIDHSGLTYLMGRNGNYLGFFPPGTSADRMVEIIRPCLAQH